MSWYGWAIRSRLEPVKKLARMVKKHIECILTAFAIVATSAGAESLNTMIQKINRVARGHRKKERLKTAI